MAEDKNTEVPTPEMVGNLPDQRHLDALEPKRETTEKLEPEREFQKKQLLSVERTKELADQAETAFNRTSRRNFLLRALDKVRGRSQPQEVTQPTGKDPTTGK